jgi:hypothetical protein
MAIELKNAFYSGFVGQEQEIKFLCPVLKRRRGRLTPSQIRSGFSTLPQQMHIAVRLTRFQKQNTLVRQRAQIFAPCIDLHDTRPKVTY